MTSLGLRVQSLERALPAIAGFIANRTGIPIIRASRAATDNRAIYLPRRRSEIDLSEADLVKSVGYIYHECGHILHSNFALSAKTPLQRAITGALEDIRIEDLVMKGFPAARRYLTRLVELVIEEGREEGTGFVEVKPEDREAAILQWYILYRLRAEALLQLPMAALAASVTEIAKQRFPAGMLTRLDALMFEVTNCKSEDEVFELADAIIQMIRDEQEKEDERKAEQQNQETGQDDGAQGDSQQQGSQGDGTSSGDDAGSENGQQMDGQPDFGAALNEILNMSENDIQQDIGAMLQNALNAAADTESNGSGPTVNTPNVYTPIFSSQQVEMAEIRGSINAIRTKVMQWMASASEEDVSHSRSGMMIDSSRVWQGRFGGSIFLRKEEGIDLNAAVHFTMDRSGSMEKIIKQAVQATVGAIAAFDTPGIETQVSLFPWYENGSEGDMDEGVAIIKRWGEKPRALASRIGNLSTDGGTPMAEAILAGSNSLLCREETLKILIVGTDGVPDDIEATKHVIQRARQSGIIVLGLGIGLDPSHVFDEQFSSCLSDISELSGAMVKLLRATFEATRQLR